MVLLGSRRRDRLLKHGAHMTGCSERGPFCLSLCPAWLVIHRWHATLMTALSMGMGERGARGVEDGVGNGPVRSMGLHLSVLSHVLCFACPFMYMSGSFSVR